MHKKDVKGNEGRKGMDMLGLTRWCHCGRNFIIAAVVELVERAASSRFFLF